LRVKFEFLNPKKIKTKKVISSKNSTKRSTTPKPSSNSIKKKIFVEHPNYCRSRKTRKETQFSDHHGDELGRSDVISKIDSFQVW